MALIKAKYPARRSGKFNKYAMASFAPSGLLDAMKLKVRTARSCHHLASEKERNLVLAWVLRKRYENAFYFLSVLLPAKQLRKECARNNQTTEPARRAAGSADRGATRFRLRREFDQSEPCIIDEGSQFLESCHRSRLISDEEFRADIMDVRIGSP
jgi:hypothetical protein